MLPQQPSHGGLPVRKAPQGAGGFLETGRGDPIGGPKIGGGFRQGGQPGKQCFQVRRQFRQPGVAAVPLQQCELGVVMAALLPATEGGAQAEDALESAHQHPFQLVFGGSGQIPLLSPHPHGNRLEHGFRGRRPHQGRGLHFQEVGIPEPIAYFFHNPRPQPQQFHPRGSALPPLGGSQPAFRIAMIFHSTALHSAPGEGFIRNPLRDSYGLQLGKGPAPTTPPWRASPKPFPGRVKGARRLFPPGPRSWRGGRPDRPRRCAWVFRCGWPWISFRPALPA